MPAVASGQIVKIAVEDRLAVVTIDRPPVNALNRQAIEELNACLDAIKADDTVKVIILTGGGSFAFIAGADIKEISQLAPGQQAAEVAAQGQAVISKLERLGKPVIAAINGVCLGGGNELAMACHLRVAGDRTRFGQPEINLGIIPGFGGTQRLPRIIGKGKALELMLTGDVITAQEAHRLGLVNHVVPQDQVMKVAKDLARKIASKGQIGIRKILEVVDAGLEQPLDTALAAEARAFGVVADTEDCKEGIGAFLQKRQPQFKDR